MVDSPAPRHRQNPQKDNHFDKFGTTKCQIGKGKCPPQGKCLQTMGIYLGGSPLLDSSVRKALFLFAREILDHLADEIVDRAKARTQEP